MSFAAMTLLTAWATSIPQLLGCRFISGIGLGCIMPNATALIGEYSPRRRRVTLMMSITVGFTAGAALWGFASAWLIPAWGWRSVFSVGGAIPLAIAVAMYAWLPESLQFLVVRGGKRDQIVKWLQRIDPTVPTAATTQYVVQEQKQQGVPTRATRSSPAHWHRVDCTVEPHQRTRRDRGRRRGLRCARRRGSPELTLLREAHGDHLAGHVSIWPAMSRFGVEPRVQAGQLRRIDRRKRRRARNRDQLLPAHFFAARLDASRIVALAGPTRRLS